VCPNHARLDISSLGRRLRYAAALSLERAFIKQIRNTPAKATMMLGAVNSKCQSPFGATKNDGINICRMSWESPSGECLARSLPWMTISLR